MDWKTLLFSPSGRINRARYWITLLIIDAAFMVVYLPVVLSIDKDLGPNAIQGIFLVVVGILGIALSYCGIILAIKRFHDRGKSGWWVLISLVPLIGGLWFLIECGFLRGTTGRNRFGADPLAPNDDIIQVFGTPERPIIR